MAYVIKQELCSACHRCRTGCPVQAIRFKNAKYWIDPEKCISCGKCDTVCPLANIRLQDGKPVWGDRCTHCMACICRCPKEAIEYGKHSEGLPRYVCGKKA